MKQVLCFFVKVVKNELIFKIEYGFLEQNTEKGIK